MNTIDLQQAAFGKRLQQTRVAAGYSQTEVGEWLRTAKGKPTGKGTVSAWETGRGWPDLATLKSLARKFDVSVDYLLFGEALAWPFTPDLYRAVKALNAVEACKAESVLRAYVGLPQIAQALPVKRPSTCGLDTRLRVVPNSATTTTPHAGSSRLGKGKLSLVRVNSRA